MSKRFTATEKWEDPFFHGLDNNGKLAWLFLLDKCDNAGIWNVNYPLMEFFIGCRAEIGWFKGRVIEISDDKWFIPKFVTFQYGDLNKENRAHLSVIRKLEKEGASKDLISPFQGAKDKEQDKEKDKEEGIGAVGERVIKRFSKPTVQEIADYSKSIGFNLEAEKFFDYYESKGWLIGKSPMKDWKAAIRNWNKNTNGGNSNVKSDHGYATAQTNKYPD